MISSFFTKITSLKGGYIELIALAIISFLFTWWVISWSQAHGKLSVIPDYDDSHSLVEGALRLQTLHAAGFWGLISDYLTNCPHSFLHYYYTSLLFAVFGVQQSAPYWCNIILLFGVLVTFYRRLPEIPVLQKFLMAGIFLGIPVCFHLVHDFRSEVTMAGLLFIACGLMIEVSWSLSKWSWKLFLATVLFLLAFAIKPAMFPYTGGVLGLCTMLAFVGGFLLQKPLAQVSREMMLLWICSPSLLVVHLLFHREEVLNYINQVAFRSDFWKLHGTPVWCFHWIGGSGLWQLSAMKTVFMVLMIAVPCLAVFGLLRPFSPDTRWYSLVFLTLGTFAGVAINQVNNFFFGMTFQLLLATTALAAMSYLYGNRKLWVIQIVMTLGFSLYWYNFSFYNYTDWYPLLFSRRFLFVSGLIGVFTFLASWFFRIPSAQLPGLLASAIFLNITWSVTQIAPFNNYNVRTVEEAGQDGLIWRREGPSIVLSKLAPYWHKNHPPVVWVSSCGWVDARTLSWEAILQGKPWRFYGPYELPHEPRIPPPQADLVIVPSPSVPGRIILPDSKAEDDQLLMDWLQHNHYKLVAVCPSLTQSWVQVYAKINKK
jgi:hypothetical protein